MLVAAAALTVLAVLAEVLGIKELATAPARQRAKTETRTISFIARLPPSIFLEGLK